MAVSHRAQRLSDGATEESRRTGTAAIARRGAARTRWSDASGRTASREESGTTGGQRRAPSPAAESAPLVTRPVPSHRVPARDGRLVDARGREGDGDVRGQREDALASGSPPTPGGLGERTRNDRPGPPLRALSHPVAGVVALSGWRPDACPPSDGRTAHQRVRVLWDDGRTPEEDGGRLPRRREEAAAPRRDVARGGADPGADCARGPSAQHIRACSTYQAFSAVGRTP